jgi:hypothetical protein
VILLPVVQVFSCTEAREALRRDEVQGVLYGTPTDNALQAALANYRVPFKTAIGPLRYTPKQPNHLRPLLLERLERLHLSDGAVAEDILATLSIFGEILGGRRPLEYKIRFQRKDSVASRPHYDPSALTLVRALMGPGTWLLPKTMPKLQVPGLQTSIYKGDNYPGSGRTARMLHDYPSPDDPAMTEQGRIVLIALSRHGV